MRLDNPVDGCDLVARDDEESVEIGSHGLVGRDRKADRGLAAEVAALADEDGRRPGRTPLDRLIHPPPIDLSGCGAPLPRRLAIVFGSL